MSYDITYCANKECKYKECKRHTNNIKTVGLYSFAYLEGTDYCLKNVKEHKNNE